MTWEETIIKNKRDRAEILYKADKDLELQRIIIEKCSRDPVFYINNFCWTFNPNLSYPYIPFLLYPKQEALILDLEKGLQDARKGLKVNLILDKPRNVGATFTVMAWISCHFLFDDFTARVGSRKEEYVDKSGDKDTLFYKIDYILDRLPFWMVPNDLSRGRTHLSLSHPFKENVISGESANQNFARGGRKSMILFDELAFWETAQSSWESAGEASNFRVAMSTPPETARDSFFHKLLTGRKGNVRLFSFSWNDVAGRDEKWLKEAKETKSEEEFAREIMKSYDGVVEGRVYMNDLKLSKMSDAEYNGNLPLFISWDFGLDSVAMIWWQKDFKNNKLYIIDCYTNSNKSIDWYIPFVTGEIISGKSFNYSNYELDFIKRHREWSGDITHFGDPSVEQRHLSTGESTRMVLEDQYNIYIQSKSFSGRKWTDLRDKARLAFRRLEFNQTRSEPVITALRLARYPKKRENNNSQSDSKLPIHDATSHFRSSFEYFCDNEPTYFIQNGAIIEEENETFDRFEVI
jgi:hypothetical protein